MWKSLSGQVTGENFTSSEYPILEKNEAYQAICHVTML